MSKCLITFIIFALLYLIAGCITAFICQQCTNSSNKNIRYVFGICFDDVPVVIVMWPIVFLVFISAIAIPWLLKKLYTGFIFIIFVIIALVKKEEKDETN